VFVWDAYFTGAHPLRQRLQPRTQQQQKIQEFNLKIRATCIVVFIHFTSSSSLQRNFLPHKAIVT
jgi:hypothetical protein